jgi:hypothetical protein
MCGICGPEPPKPVPNATQYVWETCKLDRALRRFKESPELMRELHKNPAQFSYPSGRWQYIAETITTTHMRMIAELKMLNSKKMSEMLNDNVHEVLFPTWL